MNFKEILKKFKKKEKPVDTTWGVVGQEDTKNWHRTFERRKHQLNSYLSFWTDGKKRRDVYYMGGMALLVIGVAYVWFNIGINLAEKKFLAEKEREIEHQIALQQQEAEKQAKHLEKDAVSTMEEAAAKEDKSDEQVSAEPSVNKGSATAVIAKAEPVAAPKWKRPVAGEVKAKYGEWYFHPVFQEWRYEEGVDFAAEVGEPVFAVSDGTVKEIINQRGMGKIVVVDHGDFLSKYTYCVDVGVSSGAKIKKGDQIGIIEKIGEADPFLHYEVIKDGEPVNPEQYMKGY